jgi:hypothetical protein
MGPHEEPIGNATSKWLGVLGLSLVILLVSLCAVLLFRAFPLY